MVRYVSYAIITTLFLLFQVSFAGDLVQGLRETNDFIITKLIPALGVAVALIAGVSIWINGRDGLMKALFLFIGTALIYCAAWFVRLLQGFFN